MGVLRWVGWLGVACLLAAGTAAGDGGRPAHELQADEALARVEAGDTAALATLVAADSFDVWRAADALMARGRADAARALASAAPQTEFAPLLTYLSAWDVRGADPARRESLARAFAAHQTGDVGAMRAVVEAAPAGPQDVLGLSLEALRAAALEGELALAAWSALVPAAERLGWQRFQIQSHARAAALLAEAGRLDEAAQAHAAAIRAGDRTHSLALRRDLRAVLVNMWYLRGQVERALGPAEEGLALALESGDAAVAGLFSTMVAAGLERLGDVDRALELYAAAAQQWESHGLALDPGDPAHGQVRMAALAVDAERLRVLLTSGRQRETLPVVEQLIARADRLGAGREAAFLRFSRDLLRVALDDDEAAVRRLSTLMLGFGRQPESAALRARAAYATAIARLRRGSTGEGVAALQRARVALAKEGLREDAAAAALMVGAAQEDLGDFEAARASYVEALQDLAGLEIPSVTDRMRPLLSLLIAALDLRAGQGEAREPLLRALEALRPDRGYLLAGALQAAAIALLEAGEPEQAAALAREACGWVLTLTQGQAQEAAFAYGHRLRRVFHVGMRAALARGDFEDLAWFVEGARARAMRDALVAREGCAAAALPPELGAALAAAQAQVVAAEQRLRRAVAERDTERLGVLYAARDRARDQAAEVVARAQREAARATLVAVPTVPTLAETRAVLAPGEALVSYVVSAELPNVVALVLEPQGGRYVDLGPRDALLANVGGLSADDRTGDPRPRLLALRERMVAPLALPPRVTRVLVSPDGALHGLPLAWLFEPREVTVMPSGAVLRVLAPQRALKGEGVLALGDPEFHADRGAAVGGSKGPRLTPLPATREEAQAVGDVVLLGAEASESRLRAALAQRPRWRAVHLATHGLIDMQRPLESALALAQEPDQDGRLTVADIFTLRIPTDLAVLSACETARGLTVEGEGVNGLTRAFLLAGADRVLVSLWKVEDAATLALMEHFHARWKAGQTAASALREAQAHVRAQPRWAHPYYWAAWTLWGLP